MRVNVSEKAYDIVDILSEMQDDAIDYGLKEDTKAELKEAQEQLNIAQDMIRILLGEETAKTSPKELPRLPKPSGWCPDTYYTKSSQYGRTWYMCAYCGKKTLGITFDEYGKKTMHRKDCPLLQQTFATDILSAHEHLQ